MELIYAWIEKFRNYEKVELNFSDKFIIKYIYSNKVIEITPNKYYISIYPEHITNINAIVGKNGVGKTNIIDVLGLKADDRNKNNAEFEVIYKNKSSGFGHRIPHDIEAEIKHSIYFFIYYMGKDANNQDLFCFEGNDIESFQNIVEFGSGVDVNYWKIKYWFAFICNYSQGKLIHKYDLNTRLGEYTTEYHKDGVRYYGEYRTEQDKFVILSLRENLNEKYYDDRSTKAEDDYKISVPKRIAKFQSKFLAIKVKMLFKQLQKPKRQMFQDNKYTLKIRYNNFFLADGVDDKDKLVMSYSYKELDGTDKEVCKVLESFVQYYFKSIYNPSTDEIREIIEAQLSDINIKIKSFEDYKNYYFNIIKILSDYYFSDKGETQHILKCYMALAEELSKNKNIMFFKDYIYFNITKQVRINELIKVIDITIDEKIRSDFNETFSVFGGFFDYSIENLSDGENAYLGFFASLYEQISLFTPSKEKYIILLDEPESRMHPELTRNFINELILFLKDINEDKKKFQVIISTHSPFILSDIQSNNIIYLEKDDFGHCKPVKKTLNTFGANIHTLLKDGFFMTSTMGEFATNKIKEVTSFIDESDTGNVTEMQKNKWLYIINSIGEPLIQNRIIKMFNDKFLLNYTDLYNENLKLKRKLTKYAESDQISETIEILKNQIEKLQIHVNDLEGSHNDKN
ncbi:AAA family ATPase [Oscillospiraceae bacterium PP1C4]